MITAVTLTPEQYDILWEDLRLGEQPYPVAVRSHGVTMEERTLIRRRVYGELTASRLAEGRRAEPRLVAALDLLARAPVAVDMIWLPQRDATKMRNALAVAAGDHGLLAELTEGGLRLEAVRGANAIAALLGLLPTARPAPGRSITVPADALMPAAAPHPEPAEDTRYAAQPQDSIYQPAPPSAGSTTGHQIRSLEALLAKPRLRGGQIVANIRDRHGRRRRSHPLEWFDTEDGRCVAQLGAGADGRQHLMMAPADTTRIVSRIHEMLTALSP